MNVCEDDFEEDCEITSEIVRPSAANASRDMTEMDEEEDNLHHLIMRDSVIQGTDEQLFHKRKNNEVVFSPRGKGIKHVRKFLESFYGKDPRTVNIHTRSNDLTKDSPRLSKELLNHLLNM